MAVYRRQAVFVADFLSDPEWSNFRDKPVPAGLLADWPSPIMSHDGKALGTFGMYFREVRHPKPSEIRLIDYASRIAGIAIERERSQAALRLAVDEIKTSEGQLRQTVDAIPQTIFVLGADGSVVYANRTVRDYVGYSADELMESDFREQVFHAEDFERLRRRGVMDSQEECSGKTSFECGGTTASIRPFIANGGSVCSVRAMTRHKRRVAVAQWDLDEAVARAIAHGLWDNFADCVSRLLK